MNKLAFVQLNSVSGLYTTENRYRRRAEKTIHSLLSRIFEYSVAVEENPVEYCQDILDDANEKLKELEEQWTEKRNREAIISDFESLLMDDETCNQESEGIEGLSSDLYRPEIYPLITTVISTNCVE